MAYGEIYIDQIVYSTPTGDVAIDISGINYNYVTLTGVSGIFTLASGETVKGITGQITTLTAESGTFTGSVVTGATLTGLTLQFPTGNFGSITGTAINISRISGISEYKFESGTVSAPSVTFSGDLDTGFGLLTNGSLSFIASGTEIAEVNVSGLSIKDGKKLSFEDSDSTNSIVLQVPTGLSTNLELTLPTGDGTSGQVLEGLGGGALGWRGANAVSAMNYQEFTSNGTWNKPPGVTVIYVECIGGGGGGGSGRRGLPGTGGANPNERVRAGGGGGAGGQLTWRYMPAALITGTGVSVTIGAGGAGGPGITTDNTSGISGEAGGQSSFGDFLTTSVADGGDGGMEGSGLVTGGLPSRYGGNPSINGFVYAIGNPAGTSSSFQVTSEGFYCPGGGGGGGAYRSTGLTAAPGPTSGGKGFRYTVSGAGDSQNRIGGGAPGSRIAGQDPNGQMGSGSGDGGGGGALSGAGTGISAGAAGTIGGVGGPGAFPGGGGGGGGPSNNGYLSGSGGTGGSGLVRVWAW